MRLLKALRQRVKDVELKRREIVVYSGTACFAFS